uniref:Mitochondrial fission factor n=1 Tax=Sinocyclocheilus anshuiensis TaxID=1608454 RepID=A0A671MFV0_9TELE
MNGAAFPSPTAEMAEMNRIHCELEYTEGISQRMRIPVQLRVASYEHEEQDLPEHKTLHTAMMHVPQRIVVAGDSDDMQFPRDLDLIQSTQLESTLSLKTPPRVLTLNERPIDFLEMEQLSSASQPSEEACLGHTGLDSGGRNRRHGCCGRHLSTQTDCQVEPAFAALGGGEQRESQARNDHVFHHCSFLAYQQLGLVPSLKLHGLCNVGGAKSKLCPSVLCVKL